MNTPRFDPKQTLLVSRVIWAALLMGVGMIAAVFAFLIRDGKAGQMADQPETLDIFFYAEIGMVALMIPLGLFVRGQVFKSGWVGDVVKPQQYLAGNIVLWAMCEAPAMFGIIACFLAGKTLPYAIPPAVALAMLVLLYPNGKAMFPSKDRYSIGER